MTYKDKGSYESSPPCISHKEYNISEKKPQIPTQELTTYGKKLAGSKAFMQFSRSEILLYVFVQ